jgi:hypothetical protein
VRFTERMFPFMTTQMKLLFVRRLPFSIPACRRQAGGRSQLDSA